MRHIISTYAVVIVFLLNIFMCISVSNATAAMAEAKEYKAQVIDVIENSNFNPKVIAACELQAREAGYELWVTHCIYDENYDIQTAEVILKYNYALPLLGIMETKITRGIAR